MTSSHSRNTLCGSRCIVLLCLVLPVFAQNGWNSPSTPAHVAAGIIVTAILCFFLVLAIRMIYLRRSRPARAASVAAPVALAYNASSTGGLPSYWASRRMQSVPAAAAVNDDYPPPPGTPPPPPPYPGKPAHMEEQRSAHEGAFPVTASSNPFTYQPPRAPGTHPSLNPWADSAQQLPMPNPSLEPPPAAYIQDQNAAASTANPWAEGRPPRFSVEDAATGGGAPTNVAPAAQASRFGWFRAQ